MSKDEGVEAWMRVVEVTLQITAIVLCAMVLGELAQNEAGGMPQRACVEALPDSPAASYE